MAYIIPPGFGILAVHTLTTGDPEHMVWTVGLDCTEWITEEDLPQVAADAWNGSISAVTSEVVSLVQIDLKMGPNVTGPTYTWLGDTPGTDLEALPPPNCAVLVQKRTLLGGRMNRGRMYLPGISAISSSLDSGGNFGGADASAVSTAVNGFFNELVDVPVYGTATPVLLHSASSDPTPIADFVVSPKLATQRRRLRP